MSDWIVQSAQNGTYICRRCGKEFTSSNTRRRVYCSPECARPKQPIIKACEYCGETFKPNHYVGQRQRFCCEECQRAWWLENRDQGKVYTYICQNCGKEYTTNYNNRDTCCSRECAFELLQRTRAVRRKQAMVTKTCPICGHSFEGTVSGSDYCSEECRSRSYEHVCIECGRPFVAEHGGQSICSEDCRLGRARRKYQEYMTEKIGDRKYTCEGCGKEFITPYGDKRRRYCSKQCQRISYRREHPEVQKRWRNLSNHKRRARKHKNGRIDNIDHAKVFERDGWRCGICGEKVDPALDFPHPKSATLDHIIPLAQGGTHTWRNVQLAHFVCNSKKRDVGGGQLRLGLTEP